MHRSERFKAVGYLAAFITPLLIAAVMELSWPLFEPDPVTSFLIAVILSSWFGGYIPGLLSLAVSFAVASFFFMEPYLAFAIPGRSDVVRLMTVGAVGIFIALVCEVLQREKASVKEKIIATRTSEEERFRAVADCASDAIVVIDEKSKVLYANATTEKIFGYAATELIGGSITELMPLAFRSRHTAGMSAFVGSGKKHISWESVELPGQHKNGNDIPLEISFGEFTKDGERNFAGIIRDVSQRRSAELALSESEARLRGIIDSALDAVITVDESQRIVLFNKAAVQIFGIGADDAIGKTLDTFIPPVLHPGQDPTGNFASEIATRIVSAHRITALRANGEKFPIEASISQAETNGRSLFTIILRDVTERQRSDQRLRSVIDGAPNGIVLFDQVGSIVLVNVEIEKLFGYGREELLGKSIDLLVPDQPRRGDVKTRINKLESLATRLLSTDLSLFGKRKDGTEFPVEIGLNQLETEQGTMVLGTIVDITDRRNAEERHRRLNEELEERVADRTAQLLAANSELESFSYSVSHDLRAPLRHINGFSQALLEDYSDKLDNTGKGYLNEVRGATREMAELIDDLLLLARVTRSEMDPEPVDLSSLASDVITELEKMDPTRSIRFSIQPGLSAVCDRRLTRILLMNLFGNAWKFTSKVRDARAEFGQTGSNGNSRFFVRDNGAGFDMTYSNKLFNAFQRLHSAKEFEGTGIGLATVRRIVTRHGGVVAADGEVGKGAVFFFSLVTDEEGNSGNKQLDIIG